MPKVSSDMEAPKALNYIEKLVAELCPGGVDVFTIDELISLDFGVRITKSTHKGTKYPVYGGGGESFRTDNYNRENKYVVSRFAMSEKCVRFVGGKFWILDSGFTYSVKHEFLSYEYMGYWLLDHQSDIYNCSSQSAQKNLKVKNFKKFEVPVPPLEIQNAIVEILDKFTKLEAELEAELAARRAQYEYYRNSLFENLSGGGSEILGNLGKFIRGNGLQKKDLCVSGKPAIHYGQIYTQYGIWAQDTMSYIDESNYNKLRKAQPGSIIIATTSENDEDLGKAVAWMGNKEVAVSGDSYIYEHSMNPKYVSYFFSTYIFHDQKKKYITGTKVRRISGGNLAKIKIPTPPLAEQERIVKILDKFDVLVNDISSGLPAEIEARRKQYEYYRDRLITFPRKFEPAEQAMQR